MDPSGRGNLQTIEGLIPPGVLSYIRRQELYYKWEKMCSERSGKEIMVAKCFLMTNVRFPKHRNASNRLHWLPFKQYPTNIWTKCGSWRMNAPNPDMCFLFNKITASPSRIKNEVVWCLVVLVCWQVSNQHLRRESIYWKWFHSHKKGGTLIQSGYISCRFLTQSFCGRDPFCIDAGKKGKPVDALPPAGVQKPLEDWRRTERNGLGRCCFNMCSCWPWHTWGFLCDF